MPNRILTTLTMAILLTSVPLMAQNWPHWRGPSMNGISTQTGLPTKWSKTENVAWSLAMPARSGSTPIIWGDHVFLNVADAGSLYLWNVNRLDGTVRWKRLLAGGDKVQRKANNSTPSPAVDGRTVWAMTGNGILKAFDFAGKELWTRDLQKDYGTFGIQFGYGGSPLLHDGALYIPVLHGFFTDDPSYVLKISAADGKTVWRVERPTNARNESPDSYTTPAIIKTATGLELVVSGGDVATGHDLASGKELWRVDGLNPQNNGNFRIVASPLVHGDLLFVPSRERPMLAIKAGGRGDVTSSHVLWSFMNGPDVPTPVTDGKYLYSVNDRGIVYCLDVKTGATIYGPQRLRSATYSASPLLADGRIYITDEDGVTSIFKAGPTFEVIGENSMGEYTLSSFAVSGGQLFLRTDNFLYAIGPRKP